MILFVKEVSKCLYLKKSNSECGAFWLLQFFQGTKDGKEDEGIC